MSGYVRHDPDLQAQLDEVREILRDSARSRHPDIEQALSGLVAAGGKMLRPTFLLISSRFGTPDRKKIGKMAAAVECMHMATLVHDDVIDDAAMRRGSPALHTRYGKKQAILLGDFLFAKSFSLIAEYADAENARRLADVVMQILRGEITQSSGVFIRKRSVREYLQRIAGKTAILFAVSCSVGASESGVPDQITAILRRIGYDIGMGFQIIDDILDFEGAEDVVGKPVGNDLRQGIYTLPLILAQRDGRSHRNVPPDPDVPTREDLDRLLSSPPYGEETVSRIIDEVKRRGGIEGARGWARRYTERAYREIDRLPPGNPREALRSLAGTLLGRIR